MQSEISREEHSCSEYSGGLPRENRSPEGSQAFDVSLPAWRAEHFAPIATLPKPGPPSLLLAALTYGMIVMAALHEKRARNTKGNETGRFAREDAQLVYSCRQLRAL